MAAAAAQEEEEEEKGRSHPSRSVKVGCRDLHSRPPLALAAFPPSPTSAPQPSRGPGAGVEQGAGCPWPSAALPALSSRHCSNLLTFFFFCCHFAARQGASAGLEARGKGEGFATSFLAFFLAFQPGAFFPPSLPPRATCLVVTAAIFPGGSQSEEKADHLGRLFLSLIASHTISLTHLHF